MKSSKVYPTYFAFGALLIYAVLYSWMRSFKTTQPEPKVVSPLILAIVGAVLGLLSGLTGVGGGIFLSPLLLRMNWAPVRTISGIAAMFILVNSISGLLGVLTHHAAVSPSLPYWVVAVMLGGYIGARLGSRHLNVVLIQRFLSVVLLISGLKMLLT